MWGHLVLLATLYNIQSMFVHEENFVPSHYLYELSYIADFSHLNNIDEENYLHERHLPRPIRKRIQPAKKQIIVTLNKKVKVINMSQQIPPGWRILTLFEGKQMKSGLKKLLNRWSIVAFDKGKMHGPGYKWNIDDTYGPEVGQRFIVENS